MFDTQYYGSDGEFDCSGVPAAMDRQTDQLKENSENSIDAKNREIDMLERGSDRQSLDKQPLAKKLIGIIEGDDLKLVNHLWHSDDRYKAENKNYDLYYQLGFDEYEQTEGLICEHKGKQISFLRDHRTYNHVVYIGGIRIDVNNEIARLLFDMVKMEFILNSKYRKEP